MTELPSVHMKTRPLARRRSVVSRRAFLVGVGATVPLGLSGYAVGVEPLRGPLVVTYQLSPHDWRPAHGVLRIAVVADIHACDPFMPVERIETIVDVANALRPDLVVLLGDFVHGLKSLYAEPVPMADWSGPLAALHAPQGVYSVLGNHDWWVEASEVRRALEARAIPVLENDATLVPLPAGGSFWLGGLGDQLAFKGTGRGVDDLIGLTAKVPDDGRPAILLAHEPDVFPDVPARFGLTLSGHTHGGQISLPFVGRFAASSPRYGQRYVYGHVEENGRHLVISAGLGMSLLPVRFGVPPEIVIVEVGAPEALALHNARKLAGPLRAFA